LNPHILDEIRVFFEDYKKLEKKSTEVKGFLNREEAIRIFEKSVVDYKEKFAVKA